MLNIYLDILCITPHLLLFSFFHVFFYIYLLFYLLLILAKVKLLLRNTLKHNLQLLNHLFQIALKIINHNHYLPHPPKAFIEAYLAVPVNFLLLQNFMCCIVLLLLYFLAKPKSIKYTIELFSSVPITKLSGLISLWIICLL